MLRLIKLVCDVAVNQFAVIQLLRLIKLLCGVAVEVNHVTTPIAHIQVVAVNQVGFVMLRLITLRLITLQLQ